MKMKLLWQCMFSPRLYRNYGQGRSDEMYQPQGLEKYSDKVISSANILFNIGLYSSPFIGMYMLRRGFYSSSEAKFLVPWFTSLSCLLAICIVLRSIGRVLNPKYVGFVNALYQPHSDTKALLEGIRKYDFEPHAWPVTYRVPGTETVPWFENPFARCANPELPRYQRLSIQLLAYLATRTFGLRLIYPGSVYIIHHVLWQPLYQGRTFLVEELEGKRARIGTAENNIIDTMFVDRRPTNKGKTLVICCEGNSGFYEIGLMIAPARAGYSALGWNHPGFAGSTGQPYPKQEQNAIDAVLQYAINELGFKPEDIVMYGWSIGGYTATWACVNYPLRGLILDATFDDLLPLAEGQMPVSWSLLVKEVIRSHVDLNIAELLVKYNGPVQLIRRTDDEIICLRQGYISTNRGNNLLLKLLEKRHTSMSTETRAFIERQVFLTENSRNTSQMVSVDDHELRALRLIATYSRDMKATHCSPVSEDQFQAFMDLLSKQMA